MVIIALAVEEFGSPRRVMVVSGGSVVVFGGRDWPHRYTKVGTCS